MYMYMYVCIYVYISLLDSIPIGTVQRYVCTFKLNTYVFLVLDSWFNIQHSTRLTAVNRRWKMEVAVTAHLLQRRFATQYQWQYFDLAIV